jgi:subtilisin family serine protease
VIISDNEPEVELKPWTLTPKACTGAACGPGWENYVFPLTVGVTYEDGLKLRALADRSAAVTFEFARYGKLSGTSMATPHVASAAAMMLALDDTLTPWEVMKILRETARDTGDEGWDYETSSGIVDALAAAQWVAPDRFGVPPPTPPPYKRRSARH